MNDELEEFLRWHARQHRLHVGLDRLLLLISWIAVISLALWFWRFG
jgi:hypothetical protein